MLAGDTHVDLILPWEPSHFVGFVMRWLRYGKNRLNQQADYLRTYWRNGSVTRVSGLRPGGCGFDPSESNQRLSERYKLLFRLHSEVRKRNWSVRCQYNVTGGMSSQLSEVRYVREAALLK